MDDALIIELAQLVPDVRVFSIGPRPHKAGDVLFEFLVVVPEPLKNNVYSLLAKYDETRCDVVAAETFDRLAPPAYFYRCSEIPVKAIVGAAISRRREREKHDQWRREEHAREREAERCTLSALEVLILSSQGEIAALLEARLRSILKGELHVVVGARPEDATRCLHDRLDCAIVDSALADWGGLRVIDWLNPHCPPECIALLVEGTAKDRVWSLVRSRGVRRLENADADLTELLDAARRRNLDRRTRFDGDEDR